MRENYKKTILIILLLIISFCFKVDATHVDCDLGCARPLAGCVTCSPPPPVQQTCTPVTYDGGGGCYADGYYYRVLITKCKEDGREISRTTERLYSCEEKEKCYRIDRGGGN